MKTPLAILGTLALALAPWVASPTLAIVTSGASAKTVTFDTALVPTYHGAGEYAGVLRLSIAPDGTINGTYRNADEGQTREIIGGLSGDKIWLDLGRGGRLFDVQGTYDDGKIVGATYFANDTYTFTATPTKS